MKLRVLSGSFARLSTLRPTCRTARRIRRRERARRSRRCLRSFDLCIESCTAQGSAKASKGWSWDGALESAKHERRAERGEERGRSPPEQSDAGSTHLVPERFIRAVHGSCKRGIKVFFLEVGPGQRVKERGTTKECGRRTERRKERERIGSPAGRACQILAGARPVREGGRANPGREPRPPLRSLLTERPRNTHQWPLRGFLRPWRPSPPFSYIASPSLSTPPTRFTGSPTSLLAFVWLAFFLPLFPALSTSGCRATGQDLVLASFTKSARSEVLEAPYRGRRRNCGGARAERETDVVCSRDGGTGAREERESRLDQGRREPPDEAGRAVPCG